MAVMAGEVLRCLYRSERASSRVPDERIDRVAAAVGVGRAVEETMSELLALAGINVTVTVAFAAFIWRNQVQAERRNDAAHAGLSRRIDHLAESVGSRIEGLTAEVSGLGQRLARLEGWIERDRVGQEQS